LQLEGPDNIVQLELLGNDSAKTYVQDRGAVVDVRARDGHGRIYNVEVQVRNPVHYVERSLYYLCRLYHEQLTRGTDYHELRRTVAISLLDFVLFPEHDRVHSRFRLHDSRHDLELSDILEIHYLELRKFKSDGILDKPLEKWLHLLRYSEVYGLGIEPLPDFIRAEEEMVMAFEAMNKAYARDEVRELIEARLKAEWDEASRLGAATRQGLAEGREQGLAEGKAEGLAAGKAEGLAVGKAEGLREAALGMRALGVDVETILKATGVRLEA
ncbi:MAG: Rpn family recombination-promoting nuclease/putative transposase, partial [Candidatus Eremiobacteraeota bacterium]|nr:Rpn family recombination-promoting nuclease/putative transposase [Candidatus Eremiobacteraeota bacterium]